jgi:hypothetical protein
MIDRVEEKIRSSKVIWFIFYNEEIVECMEQQDHKLKWPNIY